MNIGDKVFLLYTNRETRETTCEGPAILVDYIDAPHNDEGVVVIENIHGKRSPINLEGTSSHEIDIHVVY